jgi:SPP1 family predicted phage head-tail adaptor
MKVRLKSVMAGPEGVFQPGLVIDAGKEEAETLIAAGYAEYLERSIEAAAIEPVSGEEYRAAKSTQAELNHRVHCGFIPGVTPRKRGRFQARIFDILSVINPNERNIELQFMCREAV